VLVSACDRLRNLAAIGEDLDDPAAGTAALSRFNAAEGSAHACTRTHRGGRAVGDDVRMDFVLGWKVIIQRKVSDRTVSVRAEDDRGDLVVRWRAEVPGVRWIEELYEIGEGVDLGGNWYPTRFSLPVRGDSASRRSARTSTTRPSARPCSRGSTRASTTSCGTTAPSSRCSSARPTSSCRRG